MVFKKNHSTKITTQHYEIASYTYIHESTRTSRVHHTGLLSHIHIININLGYLIKKKSS